MKKVMIVLGTRPERIKFAPLIKLLRTKIDIELTVVDTSQHEDLGKEVYNLFGICPNIEFNLEDIKSTSVSELYSNLYNKFESTFFEKPDILLIQGDTTTALVGAMWAFNNKIKIGHLESGLRTNNINSPYPEEGNRVLIDSIADYMFAPTIDSFANTHKKSLGKTYLTGNTVVDALHHITESPIEYEPNNDVIITLHRRENQGQIMTDLLEEINGLAEEHRNRLNFNLIQHKNPKVLKSIKEANLSNIKLIDPMNYKEFISALNNCKFVITDSGGLQEECVTLKLPCFVTRDTTERMEGIESGYVKLVGACDNSLVREVNKLIFNDYTLENTSDENPFGEGDASKKIYKILKEII